MRPMTSFRRWLCVGVLVALSSTVAGAAKLTDAEKQKQKTEKKLQAFEKEYDPA